jgi:PIN domain nuclease of toxin-antitoxin system
MARRSAGTGRPLPQGRGDLPLFDRMLIARATLNDLTILAVDERIRTYPFETI